MKDLTFFEHDGMFNVRAAVIVEHDENILIQTDVNSFDCLVGGRVHLGEDSLVAILREIDEELCYTVTNKDKLNLNFICENFFPWDGQICHEILFVYRLTLSNDSELISRNNFKCGDNDKYIERWITFDELKNSSLLPTFVKEHIRNKDFKYITIKDI